MQFASLAWISASMFGHTGSQRIATGLITSVLILRYFQIMKVI